MSFKLNELIAVGPPSTKQVRDVSVKFRPLFSPADHAIQIGQIVE